MTDIDTDLLAALKEQNDALRTIRGYLGLLLLMAIAGVVFMVLLATGTVELTFKLPGL